MMNWIKIKKDLSNLPDIDKPVLWLYESGGIIHDCLDKETNVELFIWGSFTSGKITHWMDVEYPNG